MSFDEPFGDDRRVPFEGYHGGIALVFDPATLPTGANGEEFPVAMVAVRTTGLQAVARMSFFASALDAFARELATAHRALAGMAELASEEGDFVLRVAYEDRGHVSLTGHLQPASYANTILNFEIESDQSYLNATLLALDEELRLKRIG